MDPGRDFAYADNYLIDTKCSVIRDVLLTNGETPPIELWRDFLNNIRPTW